MKKIYQLLFVLLFSFNHSFGQCVEPSSLSERYTTGSSTTLFWTENGASNEYEFEWGTEGFIKGTGTSIKYVYHQSHSLSGLPQLTSYDYYVRSVCGPGDSSIWVGPYTFFTDNINCPKPSNLSATNIALESAHLTWDENGTSNIYKIEWGEEGFQRGTGTSLAIGNQYYSLGSLTALTSYSYYIQAICGPGDSSVWVGPYTFSTCPIGTSTDVQSACEKYTWMDGKEYTSSNNSATHTIENATANGCDSVVTLNLTITTISQIDKSIASLNETIIANHDGASYQWLDCNDGMKEVAGESNQSYTASNNGDYAVEINLNGCVDTSECSQILSVGIIENNFNNQISIYPNPTSGSVSIDLGISYEEVKVTITDQNGKLVQSENFNTSQLLNLNVDKPSGVYILSVESLTERAVMRLIIN